MEAELENDEERKWLEGIKRSRVALEAKVQEMAAIPVIDKMDRDKKHRLAYHLVNLLRSVAFEYRRHNGDLAGDSNRVVQTILWLSPCIRSDYRNFYGSAQDALQIDHLLKHIGFNYRSLLPAIVADLVAILSNKMFILELIHLVYDCFLSEVEKVEKLANRHSDKISQSIKQLSSTMQKLIFLMTLVRDTPMDVLEEVRRELVEIQRIMDKQEEAKGTNPLLK